MLNETMFVQPVGLFGATKNSPFRPLGFDPKRVADATFGGDTASAAE